MKLLKHYLNRKGQGLTEYVLLLAFIAGLAMMLNGANLGGTVKGVVNDVVALLGGKSDKTYAANLKEWGSLSKAELAKIDNAERVRADREALANIGNAFLGLSKSELRGMLDSYQQGVYRDEAELALKATTHLNENGEVVKLDKYVDGASTYWDNYGDYGAIPVLYYKNSADGYVDASYNSGFRNNNWALNWAQQEYENGTSSWDYKTRYFYSDYMIDTANDGNRRDVRASFTFDGDGSDARVASARIYTISSGDGTMGRNLDITVTRDGYSDTKVADSRISGKYRD